jgi:hypothetical protein
VNKLKDEDLIEAIKKVDGELFKRAIIDELNYQRELLKDAHDSKWWNAFRSCLQDALKRAKLESPQ